MNIGVMACHEPRYFPGFQSFAFESERSLLDFDLILWQLEFLHFGYHLEGADGCQDLRRLLKDRKRRLEEIEGLLEQGHNLVILLSGSVPIVKDFWERLRDYVNAQADYQLSRPWAEGSKILFQYVTDLFAKEGEAARKILEENGLDRDTCDIYSFLPEYIGTLVRQHAVPVKQGSNEIDFRGDSAFLGFWESIRGVAWYDVFFSSAIGTPLLYKAGTQYPVAAWFKRRNGSIFLVPNTEYDTSDDYPTFVEAAQLLVTAVDNLTGEQAERRWVVSEQQNRIAARSHPCYVDLGRIDELRSLSVQRFDLTKLIRFCEELNLCYANDCFLAAAMLTRSIINHVPPIFGYQSFVEVANNYGSRSFKRSMQNLQNSLRNIADSHLHLPIRNKESLPTRVQVDFSSDMDVLLAEIVRVLR